jgi:hypothetical protein
LGQTGWIGCVRCEKFNCKFFVPKVAITDLPGEFAHVVPSKTETLKRNKHEFWVKRGGLGAFVAENSTASFLFQKSLNGPPGRVSHVVPSKTETPKRNKHEFWVKRGGLGVFVAENSTASFFVPKVAINGPPASFAPLFRRKPKLENATNMSFGSNRGGLGAFVAENSTARFLFQKSRKRTSRASFATIVPSKTETPKTQQT